jgi:hypothetical protein
MRKVTRFGLLAVMVIGVSLAPLHAQDLQTKLAKFLNDLYAGTVGATVSITSFKFTNGTTLADTSGSGKLLLTGTAPMIQLGGTTASFPALKQNGGNFDLRAADDSGYTNMVAASIQATGAFNYGSGINHAGTLLISGTAPSSPASCGTSPAVTTSNGASTWVITGGTGGTATGCTITMPAASTGWNCSITNITAAAAHRANVTTVQTASTTTSVTWEYQTVSTGAATAFTASDVFRGICFAY